MNTLLITFFFLLHPYDSIEQGFKQKYNEAYTYINACEHLKCFNVKICKTKNQFPINIILEIYPLSVLVLGNEIIDKKLLPFNNDSIKLNDFVIKFDKENDFKPYINNEFKTLYKQNSNSQLFVAFSRPIGNILIAELAYSNKNSEVKSIRDITQFNKSIAFLFVFDDYNKIKEVYSNINNYN